MGERPATGLTHPTSRTAAASSSPPTFHRQAAHLNEVNRAACRGADRLTPAAAHRVASLRPAASHRLRRIHSGGTSMLTTFNGSPRPDSSGTRRYVHQSPQLLINDSSTSASTSRSGRNPAARAHAGVSSPQRTRRGPNHVMSNTTGIDGSSGGRMGE